MTTTQATGDDEVRLEIYRFFVREARPPVPAEIAAALDRDQSEVEDSLQRLHDGHIVVLAPGTPYIWMANPFSALPTPFPLEVGGRIYYGNCIWDALGAIAMMGGTGHVSTWCPDCREPMRVEIERNVLRSSDGVVHFAVPARKWWDDIGFN